MPTKFNISIIKGSRYSKNFIYQDSSKNPIDLTGLEARMQIRERENSTTVELELTTANARIVLGTTDGTLNIILGATETEPLTLTNGVYDLEIYDPLDTDIVDTILEGAVTVVDGITR